MNNEEIGNKVREIFLTSLGLDNLNKVNFKQWRENSSMDIVLVAVALEKNFNIRFDLGELGSDGFSSIESLSALVAKKISAI